MPTKAILGIHTLGQTSFQQLETLLDEVERTRGDVSASEWVNELLKRALDAERQEKLDREAGLLYGTADDRLEARSFQKASLRTIVRN
jgi:hypothetical protein